MNFFLLIVSFVGIVDLVMISWICFVLYEVDFGWGKLVWFVFFIYDFVGLVILLFYLIDQGGVNIFIGMLEVYMKVLLIDVEFYFVW